MSSHRTARIGDFFPRIPSPNRRQNRDRRRPPPPPPPYSVTDPLAEASMSLSIPPADVLPGKEEILVMFREGPCTHCGPYTLVRIEVTPEMDDDEFYHQLQTHVSRWLSRDPCHLCLRPTHFNWGGFVSHPCRQKSYLKVSNGFPKVGDPNFDRYKCTEYPGGDDCAARPNTRSYRLGICPHSTSGATGERHAHLLDRPPYAPPIGSKDDLSWIPKRMGDEALSGVLCALVVEE